MCTSKMNHKLCMCAVLNRATDIAGVQDKVYCAVLYIWDSSFLSHVMTCLILPSCRQPSLYPQRQDLSHLGIICTFSSLWAELGLGVSFCLEASTTAKNG